MQPALLSPLWIIVDVGVGVVVSYDTQIAMLHNSFRLRWFIFFFNAQLFHFYVFYFIVWLITDPIPRFRKIKSKEKSPTIN